MSILRDSMRTPHQERVERFMVEAGQDVPMAPCIPAEPVLRLRAKLIMEEALETVRALGFTPGVVYHGVGAGGIVPISEGTLSLEVNPYRQPDLIEIADGCADISVVTIGTLSACGISDEPLLEEVDQSNLNKFTGDAHRRADGKWVKPSDWLPPNILQVLKDQGYQQFGEAT
jgi:predicted HAD superfamily Cof-like phosphohydrolase